MTPYTCHIDKRFSRASILRSFLLRHIPVILEDDFPYGQDVLLFDNGQHQKTMSWDRLLLSFYEEASLKFYTNYDFYYLKYALRDAARPDCDLLCAGLSYMRYGIEDRLLERNGKNISLASQDIYYACALSKKIVCENPGIRDVVLGGSYYDFFFDLSACEGAELKRISNVYYPLLGDLHNAVLVPEPSLQHKVSEIFDIPAITDLLAADLYAENDRTYFTNERTRFLYKLGYWQNSGLSWSEISEEERTECANERAGQHNKLIRHKDAYQENVRILNEFCQFARERNLRVWILTFPSTKLYLNALDPKFKELHYRTLQSLDCDIRFADLNETDLFTDADFNDMDHLNDAGAAKATSALNEILRSGGKRFGS